MNECKEDVESAVAIKITPRELSADVLELEENILRNISVRCLERKESACYMKRSVEYICC